MKIMKYKTNFFGTIPDNVIISCYVLANDGDKYLVYHPDKTYYEYKENLLVDKGCASIEICQLNKDGILESIDDHNYINLIEISPDFKKLIKKLKPIKNK